jgi:hypothetical protein
MRAYGISCCLRLLDGFVIGSKNRMVRSHRLLSPGAGRHRSKNEMFPTLIGGCWRRYGESDKFTKHQTNSGTRSTRPQATVECSPPTVCRRQTGRLPLRWRHRSRCIGWTYKPRCQGQDLDPERLRRRGRILPLHHVQGPLPRRCHGRGPARPSGSRGVRTLGTQ